MAPSDFDPCTYWENRFRRNGVSLAATGFIGMGDVFNAALYRGYAAALARILRRHRIAMGPDSVVVDAGAGSGFIEDYARGHGVRNLTGLDFSESAIRHLCTEYAEYRFIRHDLTTPLSTAIEPADLTFCLSVLYHIVDESGFHQALASLSAATKTGGHVVIADNFMPEPQPYVTGEHQRHWSRDEFAVALRSAGLTWTAIQPISFTLNYPVRIRNKRWGRTASACWSGLQRFTAGNDFRSRLCAGTALRLDLLLQRVLPWGPSSHYLLCRKEG